MRGDAKLIDIKENVTPTFEDLQKAREKIFNEIQNEENEDCKGCPFIKNKK